MLEWIPDRPALTHDYPCSLDVLVRVTPPVLERQQQRLPLNVCLVIDRSGSMGGEKIALTRQAASWVTRSLQPQDQLSVVLFDDQVEVLLPTTRVTDKERIQRLIASIQVNGSTALFDGWKCGAAQACLGQEDGNLSRVVLLTDGQANVGETNPDTICTSVHGVSEKGVQTTTMGFGRDYNETLLRSMAASGEGNHFFLETPDQIGRFFELELDGLCATVGTRVRLALRPLREGVLVEPLGEVQSNAQGEYLLADLVEGIPLEQLFRILVPADVGSEPPIEAEIRYYVPAQARNESVTIPLRLPRVSREERLAMQPDPEIVRQLAVAMAARARREAMVAARGGDTGQAQRLLDEALAQTSLPEADRSQLEQLKATFAQGDVAKASKQSMAYSHAYSRGSVVLSNLDDQILDGLLGKLIRLRRGDFWTRPPSDAHRPWERVQGMLEGLLWGEQRALGPSAPRGESSQESLAILEQMLQRQKLLPSMMHFSKALEAAAVERPSSDRLAFLANPSNKSLLDRGVEEPNVYPLGRLAPVLINLWRSPRQAWAYVVVSAQLTHQHGLVAAANVAFAAILWAMMARPKPPGPHGYLELFLDILDRVQGEETLAARAPRYDGWSGRLSEYLRVVIPDARKRSLSFLEAAREWGYSPYVLEMVPTLLYLLECHGHQPRQALQEACESPVASPLLAALTGSALGALHGRLPGAPRDETLEGLLATIQAQLGAT